MRSRVTLLILLVFALFAPLAYSDLPDQTWLGGLWDGGDNDDVILQFESTWATAVFPLAVSANQTRAPPAL